MRTLILIFTLIAIVSCHIKVEKEQPKTVITDMEETGTTSTSTDSTYFDYEKVREEQVKSQLLKREGLLNYQVKVTNSQELIMSKSIQKEDDDYLLDYTYPYLNESVNKGFKKFNDYITINYLNTEKTINEILEDNEIICDTLSIPRFRDQRVIDYKVYNTQNNLLSILMYKENYYSGMLHSTYMFECVNYDLEGQKLVFFEDLFMEGSEEVLRELINSTIYEQVNSGNIYYDCWQLTEEDFNRFKNNFVVDGDKVVFYFDDCIICPFLYRTV